MLLSAIYIAILSIKALYKYGTIKIENEVSLLNI